MDSVMNRAVRRQASKDLAKLTRRDNEERLKRVCKAFGVTREDVLTAGRALKGAYSGPARWWQEHCIFCEVSVGPISKLVTYDAERWNMVVCPSCVDRPGVKILNDYKNDPDTAMFVSRMFSPRTRHPKLTWYHHLLVAPVEDAKRRDYFLKRAEREHTGMLALARILESLPWAQLL